MDTKLEVVILPVSDVDRAKRFYEGLGWRLDADFTNNDDWRAIQLTPPGSPCSVIFGKGVTSAAPGSVQGTFLVVDDINAARSELIRRGADVGPVFHFGGSLRVSGTKDREPGPDPQGRSYSSWASFSDPDGNSWLLQEIKGRLPGRIDTKATTFASAADLASAMRRAEAAHGEHEKRLGGGRDANWSDWYAEYMAAEQSGAPLPQ